MSSILLLWQPRNKQYSSRTKFCKPMKLSILKHLKLKINFSLFSYNLYSFCLFLFVLSFLFFSVLPVAMKTSSSIRHAHSQPASPRSWPSFSQDWGHFTLSATITSLPVAWFRLPGVLPSWQSSTLEMIVWVRKVSSICFAMVLPYASSSSWSFLTRMSLVIWTDWQKVSSFWKLTLVGSWGLKLYRP